MRIAVHIVLPPSPAVFLISHGKRGYSRHVVRGPWAATRPPREWTGTGPHHHKDWYFRRAGRCNELNKGVRNKVRNEKHTHPSAAVADLPSFSFLIERGSTAA